VVTRAVATTLLDPRRRRALAAALSRLQEQRLPPLLRVVPDRHRLAPAAVRIERTRSRRRRGGEGEQLAVTVWFGEGPALPAPGGRVPRGLMRVGAGVVSAAVVAAASTLVSRVGERAAVPALPASAGHPLLPAGGGSKTLRRSGAFLNRPSQGYKMQGAGTAQGLAERRW
jgi:hypothetical protein